MDIQEELWEKVWDVRKALQKKEPEEIVKEALDIERIQELTDNGWETRGYRLILTYGGPTIILNTVAEGVEGYWGDEEVYLPLHGGLAERIERYIDRIFP